MLGLDRFEARKRVVELLEADGALVKVEDRTIATPYGDRSGVVIEPWLTDQWYVDAATLAGPAIEAVKSGAIKIVPETWAKTWFNWLENIQPWCVFQAVMVGATASRLGSMQMETFTFRKPFPARKSRPDRSRSFTRTRTSSTPGSLRHCGPSRPSAGPRRRPNSPAITLMTSLISGFDILFFWDARMAMQGIEFMGEVPWKTLYLHGLVRDATGAKMSKSKGNTVGPARPDRPVRRRRIALHHGGRWKARGRDIKLDEKRVEGYRNFATKLWNAARFPTG